MISKVLSKKPEQSKILVIDEIDAFESNAYGFLALIKHILACKTNTIIIGIANSVDLPFRKKGSAIAMRDAQVLFEPYDESQI
jgi:nucleoside-triphosphatase THEP1